MNTHALRLGHPAALLGAGAAMGAVALDRALRLVPVLPCGVLQRAPRRPSGRAGQRPPEHWFGLVLLHPAAVELEDGQPAKPLLGRPVSRHGLSVQREPRATAPRATQYQERPDQGPRRQRGNHPALSQNARTGRTQDPVLHQRQPRITHAADSDHEPTGAAPDRTRRVRAATARRRDDAAQCAGAVSPRQRPARRRQAGVRPYGRAIRAHRYRRADTRDGLAVRFTGARKRH